MVPTGLPLETEAVLPTGLTPADPLPKKWGEKGSDDLPSPNRFLPHL